MIAEPKSPPFLGRLLVLGIALGMILLPFFAFVRPWYLGWGTTEHEASMALPGDEIVPHAASQDTRAITIDAPVDTVWPWLAQLGQDRGGFYSYDLLENIVGCEMPTDDVLRPDKLSWKLGDKFWMYPPDKAGGSGFATLKSYIPGNALGFGTRVIGTPLSQPENGSWSFALLPIDKQHTRLLVRGRGPQGRSLLGVAFDRGIFEPLHFAMERRMMIGIKQLAEGGDRGRVSNHLSVALWTIVFFIFVGSIWTTLRCPEVGRGLVGLFLSAALFQFLSLGQPPLWIAAVLVASLLLVLWSLRAARREANPKDSLSLDPSVQGI